MSWREWVAVGTAVVAAIAAAAAAIAEELASKQPSSTEMSMSKGVYFDSNYSAVDQKVWWGMQMVVLVFVVVVVAAAAVEETVPTRFGGRFVLARNYLLDDSVAVGDNLPVRHLSGHFVVDS